jgi:NAD(P)-dependent dehydrogenase (short-subunit alcohol dehydrogenase family)
MIRRIPQRRLGQPGDLDGALLLLAGDAGAYISGTEIVVDGGHLVSSL